MASQIVVCFDGLSDRGKQRIQQVVRNAGAELTIVPEAEGWGGYLENAEVAFGLPPATQVASSRLRFLQLSSSAYDAYTIPALLDHADLCIANARGVTAQAVAEQCLSMMFALTRRFPFHMRNQGRHVWQRAASYDLLFGATITVVGMGAIGSALARMCHGIGMHVFSVQRGAEKHGFVDRIFSMERLLDALGESQHLAMALPSIPLPKPLVGREELAAMPRGSYVYSVSRAGLLDYDAIVSALDSGQLAGAGLDVFPVEPLPTASPLWDREDVVIAPHSGGRFVGEMDTLADLFADNLERYFAGLPLRNAVVGKDAGNS